MATEKNTACFLWAPTMGQVGVGGSDQSGAPARRRAGWPAARAERRRGNAAIRQLAIDIESGQLEQIGRMCGWLAMWHRPEQVEPSR